MWVFFANHRRFCPAERPVSAPCVSASRCAVLSGETKQLAARGPGTVKKHRSRCDASHQNQGFVVCACVRARACVTFFFLLPSATPAAWGLRCGVSVVNCCFIFFSPSFPTFPQTFHPSDARFDSLPFRLKFLWLESTILATGNYASTWLSCDREEEAENEI